MAEFDDAQFLEHFEGWKKKYNKQYKNPDEEEFRFGVFKKNLCAVEDLIAQNPESREWMGLNNLSDLTEDEYDRDWGGLIDDSDSDCDVNMYEDGFKGELSSAYKSSDGSGNGDGLLPFVSEMPLVPVKRQMLGVEKDSNEDVTVPPVPVKRQKSGCAR